MTGKNATASQPRRTAPPRPTAARPAKPAAAPRPAAPKPAKAQKKRGWPLIELVLFLLVVKIAAGAYYVLSSPDESPTPVAGVADSAVTAVALALDPTAEPIAAPVEPAAPASRMDNYLAAAAGAVSPAVAQAAALPASSVSAVSAGAFMVLGQSASPEAAQNPSAIPLPPGSDDLLTPSVQFPEPAASPAAVSNNNSAAPLPPSQPAASSSVRAREQDLARKESMLATKEEALSSLENELNRQLAASEASRSEMESMVKRNEAILSEMKALREQQKVEEEQQKDARIEHLVIAYKGMKPEQAGALVDSLDDDVAVSILSAMPGRNAGQILAFVNPDKAARLTKAISERRIDPNLLLADQPEPNM
ncbi:MAG: hypothetical protein LBV79_10770 [Candidatus Adiutrix sp.]|jgi:flagellar motility protein MotE (MotC chaperone)|nr:hypothetical protein [Candidatus Adiutrix sp.]